MIVAGIQERGSRNLSQASVCIKSQNKTDLLGERNCRVLQQRAWMQGKVKTWTIKANELSQKQTALAFILFQLHTYCIGL